jgi:hypothetical protein
MLIGTCSLISNNTKQVAPEMRLGFIAHTSVSVSAVKTESLNNITVTCS